jgi:YtkA-like
MKQSTRIALPALAVLVVGVMAWLLFWPRATTSTAGSETAAGPYLVRLTSDTAPAGGTLLTFAITDGTHQPASPDSVRVEPVMTQMGHALSPVAATRSEPGTYQAQVDFPMAGQWGITVRITSDNQMNDAVLLLTVVG